jgi:DNA-binding transcriptional LysR family regulator
MLSAEPFILYNEDFSLHDRIMEACAATGFEPQIICKTSQREFMIRMVEANVGIALLPGHICDELNKTSILSLPLTNPEIYLQLSVIWKKDRYLPFAVRKWLTFIARYTQLDTIKFQ